MAKVAWQEVESESEAEPLDEGQTIAEAEAAEDKPDSPDRGAGTVDGVGQATAEADAVEDTPDSPDRDAGTVDGEGQATADAEAEVTPPVEAAEAAGSQPSDASRIA